MSDTYDSYVLPDSSPAESAKPASTPSGLEKLPRVRASDADRAELDAFGSPSKGASTLAGLKKLPNLWKYLTKDARPSDADSAATDAWGNPLQPTNRCELDNIEEEPRSAVIDDAPPFDSADVFDYLPLDIHLSHEGEPIVASLAAHMGSQGMTVSQIHEALRWASDFSGSETELFENFAAHMSEHGLTRAQADQVKVWADSYEGSEDYQDDMAVAKCEKALADIQELMGSPAYTEQMQSDHLRLIDILLCDGDGEA